MVTPNPRPPRRIHPPSPGEAIKVGDQTFRIGRSIGMGGFGAVYDCTDDWGNHLVAKIMLGRNRAYEEIRHRWQHELQQLIKLRHPNITYIYDAFEYRDTFYIVIERCSHTVQCLVSDPGLKPHLWIPHLARDVLQALHYIHGQGYVHGDIHPGNVFVARTFDRMVPAKDPTWSFKVGDLGLARPIASVSPSMTIANRLRPPEAIHPEAFGAFGPAIDVYQAGLLLLAILAKQDIVLTEAQVIEGVPRQLAESLRSPLAAPISRALRRHVAQRTPSALVLWREIQTCMK